MSDDLADELELLAAREEAEAARPEPPRKPAGSADAGRGVAVDGPTPKPGVAVALDGLLRQRGI